MKTILLLRHAKSNWDDASIPDHDRPLKKRGIKAAGRIGQLIRDQELSPELVVCSSAVRAKETLKLVMEASKLKTSIEFTDELYMCAPEQYRDVICRTDDAVNVLMLVGHNPGMEDFLAGLIGHHEAVPTGTLSQISINVDSWSHFTDTTPGQLTQLWRPRELD